MQLVEAVNEPAELVPKLTVPLGVTAVPTSLSVTVAVHVLGAFTATAGGLQVTLVDVERCVAATSKLPELVE